MNLKHVLTAGAGIIILSAAVGPLAVGHYTETQLNAQVDFIKSQLKQAPWIDIAVEDYHSGYYSATAKTVITIDHNQLIPDQQDSAETLPPLRLVLNHQITHGPIILSPSFAIGMASIESTLEQPEEYADILQHYFGDQSPYQQQTTISLFGNADMHFSIPAYSGPSHNGEAEITWHGMSGDASGDLIAMSGVSQLTSDGLEVSGEGKAIAFKGLHGDSDTYLSPNGTTLGNISLHLDQINVSTQNGDAPKNVSLSNLAFILDSDLNGELIDITEKVSFSQLNTGSDNVGPATVQFKLTNLHEQTLAAFQDDFAGLRSTTLPPEQQMAMINEKMMQRLPELLKHSPSMEIDPLKLTTEKGDIDGRLLVSFDGSGDLDLSMGPFAMIPRLSAEVDLSLPVEITRIISRNKASQQLQLMAASMEHPPSDEQFNAMLDQATEQQLTMAEQAGLLIREGDKHSTKIRFKESQLTVNGQPADQLMGILAGN